MGARKAKGDFLLFIDDDTYFSEETYRKYILDVFLKHPNDIVCADHPILSTRVLGISKKLFFDLGGFDESFETGEDADLGFRALERGIKIRKIPKSVIFHREHPTVSDRRELLLRCKNKIRYALKYGKAWISGDNVQKITPKSFFELMIKSRTKGMANVIKLVTSILSFYYYFFKELIR